MARAIVLFERELGKLKSLIDDMFSVGGILVGRLEIHVARMDLAALVRDEVARSAPVFARARCDVTLHADGPVCGSWDRDLLAQVVASLLANALKFGAGRPIEIRVGEVRGMARLVVVDHGIGIDAQALQHIFEKFERAVSSRLYGGLGLGLYIVRNIVQALGGAVRVESTPNVETSFTVELPVAGDRVADRSPGDVLARRSRTEERRTGARLGPPLGRGPT
jgi:signal transduction histidine kinase